MSGHLDAGKANAATELAGNFWWRPHTQSGLPSQIISLFIRDSQR